MIILGIFGALLLVLLVAWLFVLNSADRKVLSSDTVEITIEEEQREYKIINASRDNEKEKPLLVLLHGFRSRGSWIGTYTGFNILAEEEDFALLLPQGFRMSWNAQFCCGFAFQRNIDDVGFITKIVEDVKEEYNIDESKIYVAGFSNGGMLAQKLLIEKPGLFAGGASAMSGIGTRAGALYIDKAEDPIVLIQGEDDKYTPIEKDASGPEGFSFKSSEETLSAWKNYYNAKLAYTNDEDAYKERVYSKNDKPIIMHRLYYNQPHRWPGTRLWNFSSDVPELTRAIWEFLNSK
ncbi:MAG: PHB depolymerase family esterase [Candidatus Spechtbacterales bacterium]|nr:PHB depolymerase family esterase [Candidatus Spechtbacterales bacterium]